MYTKSYLDSLLERFKTDEIVRLDTVTQVYQDIHVKYILINLYALAVIESSLNPMAVNQRTQAYGMYQITQPALTDYNESHKTSWILKDMLTASRCAKVADWYVNKRIQKMLYAYEIPITVENVLSCYNYGIGNFKKDRDWETCLLESS